MNKLWFAATVIIAVVASAPVYSATLTFDFSFTSAPWGTVTGEIDGLLDNTTGEAATAVYIDSDPFMLGTVCTEPCNVTSTPWSVLSNVFTVASGSITAADLSTQLYESISYGFALDTTTSPPTFTFGILGSLGADVTSSTATFTLVSGGGGSCSISEVCVTPLPAALPLFGTGLGAIGLFGWRRRRRNAAAIATV
jgi:hypothetical protein